MSLATFQTALARLIMEPDFRDRVRTGGDAAPSGDLDDIERARLRGIAADPGLDVNRTLHKGFRLGKLRALLPLTCRLLGSRALMREVAAFWSERPPSGFYFLPEALEFCDFLATRRLRGRYVREVVAFERATLELQRARFDAPPPQEVHFDHDPSALLGAVASGRRPRAIPRRPCVAVARRDEGGEVHWQITEAP